MMHNKFIFVIFTFILFSPAIAQDSSLQQLEQRCEQAREEKIAPLRQKAIDECVTSNKRKRDIVEYCENFYRDYGAGGKTESGGFRQRMFNDLPECQEFYEAERQSQNPRRVR
ncbi:MAG: hypothetical protein EP297_00535 [Gammaproteobacteria bacterium]|nr:MAG: hypothetical protein EP297_00535 [Gammaproteobacteria bacterium]